MSMLSHFGIKKHDYMDIKHPFIKLDGVSDQYGIILNNGEKLLYNESKEFWTLGKEQQYKICVIDDVPDKGGILFYNNKATTCPELLFDTVKKQLSVPRLNCSSKILINDTPILSQSEIGPTVLYSNLTSVGVLSSGSISDNFGPIVTKLPVTCSELNSEAIYMHNKCVLSPRELGSSIEFSNLRSVGNLTRGCISPGFGPINIGSYPILCGTIIGHQLNCVDIHADEYYIKKDKILSKTRLYSTVVISSLRAVGELVCGSISEGFGNISIPQNTISCNELKCKLLECDKLKTNRILMRSEIKHQDIRPGFWISLKHNLDVTVGIFQISLSVTWKSDFSVKIKIVRSDGLVVLFNCNSTVTETTIIELQNHTFYIQGYCDKPASLSSYISMIEI